MCVCVACPRLPSSSLYSSTKMYRLISDKKQNQNEFEISRANYRIFRITIQKQETQQRERPKTITINPSKKLEKQETQENKIQCNNPPEKKNQKT